MNDSTIRLSADTSALMDSLSKIVEEMTEHYAMKTRGAYHLWNSALISAEGTASGSWYGLQTG